LVKIKQDDANDIIPWGTVYQIPTESYKVNQVGFKDMAFVLGMSTVYDIDTIPLNMRKQPSETSTSAKTAIAPFEE
jgi:hypothetical protein